MSKGVIVQIDYDMAYILKNDGTFISCKRDTGWRVGDVIAVPSFPSRKSIKASVISAAVLFVVVMAGGAGLYRTPVSYVEISVNPSVVLSVNSFGRVLSAKGLTDDGILLLNGISFNNLSLHEAYLRLFNTMENQGFLKDAFVQLIVSNNSQKSVDKIERTLREATEKYSQDNNMTVTIKRYAKDEYLTLEHPIPLMGIPDDSQIDIDLTPAAKPTDTIKGDNTESLPLDVQPRETDSTENGANSQEQVQTPEQQPQNVIPAPEQQPQNVPPAPEQQPQNVTPNPGVEPQTEPTAGHHGHLQKKRQYGQWRNGWWDWD